MKKSDSKFINALRYADKSSPVRAPGEDFNIDEWTQSYTELKNGSREEEVIFEAGLFVGNELSVLWRNVRELRLLDCRFADVVKAILSFSYREYVLIDHAFKNDVKDRVNGATLDHHLTALGDSLSTALSYAWRNQASFSGSLDVDYYKIERLVVLCNQIYVTKYFMDRVIWCGWVFNADQRRFEPSVAYLEYSDSEAIAQDFRNGQIQDYVSTFQIYWRQGKLKDLVPGHISLSNRAGDRAFFRFSSSPPRDMPLSLPQSMMDHPEWIEKVMAFRLVKPSGLTMNRIYLAWTVISEAFNAVIAHEVKRISQSQTPNFGISRIDLLTILISRGFKSRHAEEIISFFSYDGNGAEALWRAPLVNLDRTIYPILPALTSTNLQRTTDLWFDNVHRTTVNEKLEKLSTTRGPEFEQHVRNIIANGVSKLSAEEKSFSPKRSITINSLQIDVLWRVENRIYIAECKCIKYPANPADIGRYFLELEKGAKQSTERCEKLKDRKKEISFHTKYRGDPGKLEFIPLVITSQPLGSGMIIGRSLCISYSMIDLFFLEDSFVLIGKRGADAVARGEIEMQFPKTPDRLAATIDLFLRNPPYVLLRKGWLNWIEHDLPSSAQDERSLSWRERIAKAPDEDHLTEYCKTAVACWESLLQG